MKTPALLPLARTAVSSLVLAACAHLSASEVIHWNRVAVETTTRAMPDDPVSESRILAIVHLAMHDAANSVSPRFAGYAPSQAAEAGASVDAAVAAAAHVTLRALLPDHVAAIDAEFNHRTPLVGSEVAKQSGIAAGERAAVQLLTLRQNDGSALYATRAAGQLAGEYRPTPPDFTVVPISHWGRVQPFALTKSEQFRPTSPPAPGSPAARADLEEVHAIGGSVSTRRSFEQSEIATYWYEHSTRSWNRIARDIALARGLDVWEQARLLALVNVAMADGFIAGMEAKYHYHYWRPATAIRETLDPQWLSYLPTPPVPDYPSTHTVLGTAAATAIAQCLGTDFVSFTMTSGAPYSNITRRFWSLSQAARENGSSRVLCGLHFQTAVQAGYRQGHEIGAWVVAHTLLPRTLEGAVNLTAGN